MSADLLVVMLVDLSVDKSVVLWAVPMVLKRVDLSAVL